MKINNLHINIRVDFYFILLYNYNRGVQDEK